MKRHRHKCLQQNQEAYILGTIAWLNQEKNPSWSLSQSTKDAMPQKKDKNKPLKKITTGVVARGLSLFNLTVSSGARYASLKAGDLFATEEERVRRKEDFLTEQAGILVEEMGKLKGSLMKAGQMISVYGEHFFPPDVNKILKSLQSNSRPISWEEMEQVLNRQLGQEKMQLLHINPEPVAAASMGQVYAATEVATGRKLALKVQYPHVDRAIDSDLRALRSILTLSKLVPKGEGFEGIFREVRMMLHYESDYKREAEMVLEFRSLLENDPRFIIPEIIENYSTRRVLCMIFERGVPVDSPEIQALSQLRRNKIGMAAMELLFREIFQWRMVQTDPHFGNYQIKPGSCEKGLEDKIILYDFGAVRKFPLRYIRPFTGLVRSCLEVNSHKNQEAGQQLGFLRDTDSERVRQLFSTICFTATEAFGEKYASPSTDGSDAGESPYEWGRTDIIEKLTDLAKDAVFAFKIRTPPREAIFLDRKMVGMYFFLANLRVKFGPRDLLKKYTDDDQTTGT